MKHIVLFKLKEEIQGKEKEDTLRKLKRELEVLREIIPGIISLQVITQAMEVSTHDVALISEFESKEALDAYQIHPAHVKVVEFVKSVVAGRACFDYM